MIMKTDKLLISLVAVLASVPAFAQERLVNAWGRMVPLDGYLKNTIGVVEGSENFRPTAWGDQGNGTYINPVLNADFSDPDAIRVGDKYYMVASDFHFMGMQVLESDDLVNWKYISQIYSHFDIPGWDVNVHYSRGSWAPSIRYHDGRFYVFFCTPEEGLFMSSAESAYGPWSDLLLVHEGTGRGWEDPCPFWDEDGQAYLGRSQVGAGPIIIHKMSPDGTKLLDDGVEVYRGPTAEGTKIYKMNGYYYLSIPEGGVGPGYQIVLRSASLYGPYDKKVVLETGSTYINGPHQGALVDTPNGEWWFMHFQNVPVLGRVVHLQPVHWAEGWPVVGVDIDRNGVGEPVFCWQKPTGSAAAAPSKPATSDDFSASTLGLQWQFNHNPVDGKWSLTEKPGKLVLHALQSDNFRMAHNTVTQKLIGYNGTITVSLDPSAMADGQRAGLVVMGTSNVELGVRVENGRKYIYVRNDDVEETAAPLPSGLVKLSVDYNTHEKSFQFSYAVGKKAPVAIGEPFMTLYGFWKGVRPGLFSYNTRADGGAAIFDDFSVSYDEM